MSALSVDFSRKPSRGKVHSVRAGSLSWDSKISSSERKFSSIPTPGGTGRYDCVSIALKVEAHVLKAVYRLVLYSCSLFLVYFCFALLAPHHVDQSLSFFFFFVGLINGSEMPHYRHYIVRRVDSRDFSGFPLMMQCFSNFQGTHILAC